MTYLMAKTKGKSGEILKVLSAKDEIFEVPDLSHFVKYSNKHILEDEEWFVLDKFKSKRYRNEFIDDSFNSTNYNQIVKNQYQKIEYFCSKQNNYFLFQKLTPVRILQKKWFKISDAPSLEIDAPIIVLNDFVDAAYELAVDKLYFKKIEAIKSMFDGIEELYREATQKEVDTFLREDFIVLKDSFDGTKVKTANRKRIAMAIDALKDFTKEDKKQIFEYIKEYCEDVPVEGNAFAVSSEEHLKNILYGIDQRYYTTPIGHEKRIANSVLKIEPRPRSSEETQVNDSNH